MNKETVIIEGKQYQCYIIQTVVVGSGAAGLNAATSLYKEGQKDIAVITEGCDMGTSRNTGSDKQTYYKLTTCGGDADSVRQMAKTLYSGGSMDGDLALAEAASSIRVFYHLVDIGVPFPYNQAGEYVGYKTDHDPLCRGTSAGPLTSKFMTEALWREVNGYQIPVFDGCQVIEILTEGDGDGKRVRGLMVLDKRTEENPYLIFAVENIIYATGGEAGMYQTSVYPVSQTGGMGTALRAGVAGKNLTESQYGIASVKFRWNLSGTYQQAIPRYVSTDQEGNKPKEFLDEYFADKKDLLLAIFLKGYQWPFDPRKVMGMGSSMIDILVYHETVIRGRRVFLDFLQNPSCAETDGALNFSLLKEEAATYLANSGARQAKPIERLLHMNPAAIELYRSHGIDLCTEMLEIAVCAQHGNGGLAGNQWWESNVGHFFPVGEVNGSHGVYRPGGSALNSGQVGSLRAAQFITHCYTNQAWSGAELMAGCCNQIGRVLAEGDSVLSEDGSLLDMKRERTLLGQRMSRYGAHVRSQEGVAKALVEANEQMKRLREGHVMNGRELKSWYRVRDLLVSQIVYLSAIEDYIRDGGGSRGSYLVYDQSGEMPIDCLPEEFRFVLDDGSRAVKVQEIWYEEESCRIAWRNVRPIPEEDSWFENVWREYQQGTIYSFAERM